MHREFKILFSMNMNFEYSVYAGMFTVHTWIEEEDSAKRTVILLNNLPVPVVCMMYTKNRNDVISL